MLESSTLLVLARLLLVLGLFGAPTLLFLGLLRLLAWSRNDVLITDWLAREDTDFDPSQMNNVTGVLARGLGIDRRRPDVIYCLCCRRPATQDVCADCRDVRS